MDWIEPILFSYGILWLQSKTLTYILGMGN